jgi:hypothetical protein
MKVTTCGGVGILFVASEQPGSTPAGLEIQLGIVQVRFAVSSLKIRG